MNALTKLSKAERLLAEASSVDDVPDLAKLIDYAEAARTYAERTRLGTKSINHCSKIKILAEVKMAEIVERGRAANQIAQQGRPTKTLDLPTLNDLGIKRPQLSEANKIRSHFAPGGVEAAFASANDADRELPRAELLRQARRKAVVEKYEERKAAAVENLDGTFDVVYADPPWRYDNTGVRGAVVEQYPTMATDDICTIKVPAAKAASLFLWVTNPLLEDGLRVLSAWGFRYVTNLVWVKNVPTGAPFYVNGKHELLLLGVRGKGNVPTGEKPLSVVAADRTEHSRKPDEFYALIERMYPGLRYLEMFQRRQRDGWTGWGNDA